MRAQNQEIRRRMDMIRDLDVELSAARLMEEQQKQCREITERHLTEVRRQRDEALGAAEYSRQRIDRLGRAVNEGARDRGELMDMMDGFTDQLIDVGHHNDGLLQENDELRAELQQERVLRQARPGSSWGCRNLLGGERGEKAVGTWNRRSSVLQAAECAMATWRQQAAGMPPVFPPMAFAPDGTCPTGNLVCVGIVAMPHHLYAHPVGPRGGSCIDRERKVSVHRGDKAI